MKTAILIGLYLLPSVLVFAAGLIKMKRCPNDISLKLYK